MNQDLGSCSAYGAKPEASNPFTKAAVTDALAIDCEAVGAGPKGSKNVAARVSIVNELGECVYDTYVKPFMQITDYRTWLTGITQSHLDEGREFAVVHAEVRELLKGRKLIGHALHNDFRLLRYQHPTHLVRDTATYDPLISMAGKCHPSLKTLADVVLNMKVQTGLHDSIEDARTAMMLYQKHKKVWEESEYGWPILPD